MRRLEVPNFLELNNMRSLLSYWNAYFNDPYLEIELLTPVSTSASPESAESPERRAYAGPMMWVVPRQPER